MIFYLTYNEAPSGIFSSQVIDVVMHLNRSYKANVRLIAFISLRSFFKNRSTIKQQLSNAIVLPMYPKMNNWQKNKFLLHLYCLIYKPDKIIARSVFATKLALVMRDKNACKHITYDGRGAIAAEWNEYNVITDSQLLADINLFEKQAVVLSDFRIAVSNALLTYWRSNYDYNGSQHVVIPCTLNSEFNNVIISEDNVSERRNQIGLNSNDCVFVYSGSIAGWQSFELLFKFMEPLLLASKSNKLVLFSSINSEIEKLMSLFPTQVICKKLTPQQVSSYLVVGDYGLLIRENSVTNQVASPLKYAEYLACGLKVIISPELGDYSNLSIDKNWGVLYTSVKHDIQKLDMDERIQISKDAISYFSKNNYSKQFKQLLEAV